MKKILAVLLVAMMICWMVPGLAEGTSQESQAQKIKKYALYYLKSIEEMHQEFPEYCGDEFIMLTHGYYEMYQVMGKICIAEEQYDLSVSQLSGGKSPMIERVKEQEKLELLLDKAMQERWEKWLNGEIENVEYLEMLMKMVGVVTGGME